jgi:hypothetical protein
MATTIWQTVAAKKKKKSNRTKKHCFKCFLSRYIKFISEILLNASLVAKLDILNINVEKNKDKTFQHKLTNKPPENKQPAKMENNMFYAKHPQMTIIFLNP